MAADCGVVVRDHEGKWKDGFSKFVGRGSAILAKFWGLLEGINLTQILGYKRVEINVDSLQVVESIEKGKVEQIDCVAILHQILEVMDLMEVVIISHVYKSANACVDALAKLDSRERIFLFYDKN